MTWIVAGFSQDAKFGKTNKGLSLTIRNHFWGGIFMYTSKKNKATCSYLVIN